ncbi:hypothetical protein BH20BAC1_BH20BAC1_21090 [soil metagenome]
MIKKLIVVLGVIFPLLITAQQDSIKSGVYAWRVAPASVQPDAKTIVLFEGPSRDFSWMQMNATILTGSREADRMTVPEGEEHLYIIKTEALTIQLEDSLYTLIPGSIALLLPGEKFSLQNTSPASCEYYVMKYRSAKVYEKNKQVNSLHSFVKDWNKISFHPHDKGGIRIFFETPTSMARRMEMHVTNLNPGLKSHDPHTHRAAEIVLVIEGSTEMQIGEKFYQ